MPNPRTWEPTLLTVGQPLENPDRTAWPEGPTYGFENGQHVLLLSFSDPSPEEIAAVSKGPGQVAVIVEPPVVLLHYRFGDLYGTAPYSWHLVPMESRVPPPDEGLTGHAPLLTLLVDAATGILRAIRLATMSPAVTQTLHAAIRAQAVAVWHTGAYERAVDTLYGEADDQLETRAAASCALGT